MRFTRQSLAQASAKEVAEYRTWKMRQQLGAITGVLDVGAGLGGDTIALALRWPVVAIENDPKTLELLRHKLGVYNVADKVEIAQADARQWLDSPGAAAWKNRINAVFFDPSRRPGGKRVLQAQDWEPPFLLPTN